MSDERMGRSLLDDIVFQIRAHLDEGPKALARGAFLYVVARISWGRRILFAQSLPKIRERMEDEADLNDALDTILEVRPGYWPYRVAAVQLRDEIETLAKLVREESPTRIMEIGTDEGGSLYIWSRYIETVTTIISVDLPGGSGGGGYDQRMIKIFREFAPSKEMHFIQGDSHSHGTYERVSELVGDGVDFLFIDGDHTYEGVRKDYEMYSPLVKEGGLVALHDIVNHPNDRETVEERRRNMGDLESRHVKWGRNHPECNVDRFWEELVEEYDETRAIISHPRQTWGGIGVVRV